jgi:alpha-beta hydrolase superfamily lysophospholipase
MECTEGTFSGPRGLTLAWHAWHPAGDARAVMVLVHGLGEHGGRYPNLVGPLTEAGMAVYGFDLPGHGRSEGQRGHIQGWSDYRDSVRAFLELVGQQEPGRPVFLFGHSLGAMIAVDYVIRHPEGLAGAIVSGLPTEPAGLAKPHLLLLARLFSRIWPNLSMASELDTATLSRIPEVVRAYEDDPLVHDRTSPRWATESLAMVAWIKAHGAEIRLPILVVHGGQDRLLLPQGSEDLFAQITHPDKTLRIYPGSFHEVHNDLDHALLAGDVVRWIEAHL